MKEDHWLLLAMELQSLAQAGLFYCKDIFDTERFTRIREIAAEMVALQTQLPKEKVEDLFCNEIGYQTPKIDTRAAIFKDGKILLVQEKNGTWSLQGDWCDLFESVGTNTEKEVLEEAGLLVRASSLIAVQNREKHNEPRYAYGVCKIFVMCELLGGEFRENLETLGFDYFSLNGLPQLATEKNTAEQIAMCFAAAEDKNWKTKFD